MEIQIHAGRSETPGERDLDITGAGGRGGYGRAGAWPRDGIGGRHTIGNIPGCEPTVGIGAGLMDLQG